MSKQVVYQSPQVVPLMNFAQAMEALLEGKCVSKEEWNDSQYYLKLVDGKVRIHKPDGLFYNLVISEGDLVGKDYFEYVPHITQSLN